MFFRAINFAVICYRGDRKLTQLFFQIKRESPWIWAICTMILLLLLDNGYCLLSTYHRLRHCSRHFTESNLFNLYFKSVKWVQLTSLFSRRKMDSEQSDNVHQFWPLVFYGTVILHRQISKANHVLLTFMLYCHLVLPCGEVSNFIETGKFKPWIAWWDGAKARVILSGHVVPRVRLFTKS